MEQIRNKENTIKRNIIRLLQQQYCPVDGYTYQSDYPIPETPWVADLVVLKNATPFVVVEVKADLTKQSQKDYGFYELYRCCVSLKASFGLLTDSKIFIGYHLGGVTKEMQSFNEYNRFITIEQHSESRVDKKEFVELFNECFENCVTIREEDIVVDNGIILRLNPEIELQLFNTLIKDAPLGVIYRYTSAATLFATLDNESHRMFAVEGMNDKEDCSFLEKKIYDETDKMLVKSYIPASTDMYITSFTKINETKLSMWRMYGGETRGVCLECSIKDNKKDGFYLKQVVYEGEPSYEKLVSFVKDVKECFNRFFVFNYWNLWKAFFKSKNFSEEQEIRLLFIPTFASIKKLHDINTKWIRTDANQIVNQYIDFKGETLNYYPIRVEKVYLGANYPEQALNIVQLNKMAKGTQKMKDITIVPSSITNYRAPQL